MAGKSIEQLEIPENETDENVSNLVEQIIQISLFSMMLELMTENITEL